MGSSPWNCTSTCKTYVDWIVSLTQTGHDRRWLLWKCWPWMFGKTHMIYIWSVKYVTRSWQVAYCCSRNPTRVITLLPPVSWRIASWQGCKTSHWLPWHHCVVLLATPTCFKFPKKRSAADKVDELVLLQYSAGFVWVWSGFDAWQN